LFLQRGRNVFPVLHRSSFHVQLCVILLFFILFIPSRLIAENNVPGQDAHGSSEEMSNVVPAEEPPPNAGDQEAPPAYEYEEPDFVEHTVSYPALILKTVAVLGALIIGIYLLFRFLLKNRNKIVTDSEIIKVLATYPLAANRIIQVVDIAGQVLVLGVSESSINLITELEDKEVIDRIKLISNKESKGTGSFKKQFFKLLGGKPVSRPGQVSYLSGYKKRINRMKRF